MKKLISSFICLCMILSIIPTSIMAEESNVYEIYVSTAGDDSAVGTIDSPLNTIEGARDKIRSLKNEGVNPEDGFIVYLRGGDYQQTECFELDSRDSGTMSAPVVYSAYPGEEVTLAGGANIPGSAFKKVTDISVLNKIIDTTAREKVVVADLKKMGYTDFGEPYWPGAYSYSASWLTAPEVASPELFVDGQVQTLSRYPNNGFMKIKEVFDVGAIPRNWEADRIGDERYVPEDQRDPEDTFEISFDDDRYLKWTTVPPGSALMYGYFWYDWADHTVPIEKVENGRVYSSEPSWYGVLEGQRIYVMNLIEEIDIPGEYFLDRENGLLYLYPTKDLTTADIKLSMLEDDLIHINGAENITFNGIKMTAMRSSAVVINSGKNIEIRDCEIEYTADYAVVMRSVTRNCRVVDSYLHDVNGGIYMRSGDIPTLTAGNGKVINNVITRFSRINKTYRPAVQLDGVGNYIEHNEISDAEHCAIQYAGNNHSISYNEIYNVCKQADDMGAIYSGRSWVQRGTKIHYNYLHDIKTDSDGEIGLFIIYNDDRLSEQSIVGNLFEDCDGFAYFSNGGRDNVFSNNIIVNQEKSYRFGAIIPPDPIAVNPVNLMKTLDSVPWQNAVWTEAYPRLATILDVEGEATYPNNCTAGDNILVNCGAKTNDEEGIHPVTSQRGTFTSDYEASSVSFGENYYVPENSPVYTTLPSFKNLPVTKMGTYAEATPDESEDAVFFDDFESETDSIPDNWQLFKETSTGVMTIETEGDNKFLRVTPQNNWAKGDEIPGAITKPGKVKVFTDKGPVVVKMKIRSRDIVGVNTRQNIRLSYDSISPDTSKANEKVLFVTRDFGSITDIFCFATTSDSSVINSDYSVVNNTWYDVTAIIDLVSKKVNYIVGNKSGGYKRYNINISGSSLASLDVVSSVTLLMDQVSPGNYTDIDDVSVDYLPDVKNFYDDFEEESDEVPDNWKVALTSADTTATVREENGNKYLRLEATAQRWSSALPSVVTKDEAVSMPLTDKPVLVKYRTRLSTDSSSKIQFITRAGIPGGADSATEIIGNEYQPFTIRTVDGVTNLYYYTTNTYPSACSTISFEKDEWYDIYALTDPVVSTVKYVVGNEKVGFVAFNDAAMEKIGYASVDVIDNLSAMLCYANPGAYMDLDEVYVGYPENYKDYLPEVLSFSDTFEDAASDSVPGNWVDRTGASSLKVMEEDGNKFLRVTKNTGIKGVAQVSTRDGIINLPWKDNSRGIVIEAKIRQQNLDYRSLLMVNAPYFVKDSEIETSYSTPFFIHTNAQAYFMPDFLSANTFAKVGEWEHYRAEILPGLTKTEIRHYFNGNYITSTFASAEKMPELFNPDSLTSLSFVWRPASGKPSEATTEGYMDFDDVRIYERQDIISDVRMTDEKGAGIYDIKNGTVNINASLFNDETKRTFDVYAAVYTKQGSGWKITEIKSIENSEGRPYLEANAWEKTTGTASVTVTDDSNQKIKVFVWYRTAETDSAEKSLAMKSVCPSYVLD